MSVAHLSDLPEKIVLNLIGNNGILFVIGVRSDELPHPRGIREENTYNEREIDHHGVSA